MTSPMKQSTEEPAEREPLQTDDENEPIQPDVIEARAEVIEPRPETVEHNPQEHERWQQIQAEFVDDPRKAVGDAHKLVGVLVQRIVDEFTRERNELESQWSKGGDVSTEDLRVCLQHYREFFARLLPTAETSRA